MHIDKTLTVVVTLVLLLIAFSLVIAADDAYLRKRNISDGEMLLTLTNYLMYRITSGVMFVFLVLVLYLIIMAADNIGLRITVTIMMGIRTIFFVRIMTLRRTVRVNDIIV